MDTITYKGLGLSVFKTDTAVVFECPRRGIAWDGDQIPVEVNIVAVVPYLQYPVLTMNAAHCDGDSYTQCALLPEKPEPRRVTSREPRRVTSREPRRVTSRELAKWLAQGNGEWCMKNGTGEIGANTNYGYSAYEENRDVTDGILVRKWNDTEWHVPTAEYLNLEDRV